MPSINIPNLALPGFAALSKLPKETGQELAKFLKDSQVGIKMELIDAYLQKLGVEADQSRAIVQTIVSFRGLLEEATDLDEIAKSLTTSYKQRIKGPLYNSSEKFDPEDEEILIENLKQIFKNSKSLKLTLKANRLLSEDCAVYSSGSIITDIRVVFDDDLSEQKRNAVVVHRLNLEYSSPNKSNNFFIALTNEDLKNLKAVIDRALQKEEAIVKDYDKTIHFIGSSLK